MSWLGAGIGAFLGAQRGGILGGIIGAVVGNWVEGKAKGLINGGSSAGQRQASNGELATLAAISAMLSKLAKADGRITADEVRYCESVFDRLGLRGEKREYCIRVFRTAKNDSHSIYDYAASFASVQSGVQIREIVYDILWDLACIDGEVSSAELEILRSILPYLGIDGGMFDWECARRRIRGNDHVRIDPYEVLGCASTATDDELKRAYREKAKQLHPDMLRAQGLSEELISRANDQMSRVNAAWAEIKKERGI